MRVIERNEVGKGRRFKSRTVLLAKLKVGERVLFRAEGMVQYASVRGSAYCYAKSSGKRFSCGRHDETTVFVLRWRSGAEVTTLHEKERP